MRTGCLKIGNPQPEQAQQIFGQINKLRLNYKNLTIDEFQKSLSLVYKFHQFETSFQKDSMIIEKNILIEILSGKYVDYKPNKYDPLYKKYNFLRVEEVKPRITDMLYVMNGLRPKTDVLKFPLALFYAVGPVSDLQIGLPEDPYFFKALFPGINIPEGKFRYFVPWDDELHPLGYHFRVLYPGGSLDKRYAFCKQEPFFYQYNPAEEERRQFIENNQNLLNDSEIINLSIGLNRIKDILSANCAHIGSLLKVEFKIAGPLTHCILSGKDEEKYGFYHLHLDAGKVYTVSFKRTKTPFGSETIAAVFSMDGQSRQSSVHYYNSKDGFEQIFIKSIDEKGRVIYPENFRKTAQKDYPPFYTLAAIDSISLPQQSPGS